MKIILLDKSLAMAAFWREAFAGTDVECVCDDFASFMAQRCDEIDCIATAGNGYGILDGGYDLAVKRHFGDALQCAVQEHIRDNYHGEQPKGTSILVPIPESDKFLIHTPTMRIPSRVIDSSVVYDAMRSTLLEALRHPMIKTILIPAFGGSCGNVSKGILARMMRFAYDQVFSEVPEKLTWDYALQRIPEAFSRACTDSDPQDFFRRRLLSNPYTPLKQALRMKILCILGRRACCSWANATSVRQLSEADPYFDYIFSDTDDIPIDPCVHLTKEDGERFSVWKNEDDRLQCKIEYTLAAPQSVKDLFDDPAALEEYASELAYFSGYLGRKHPEPIKAALDGLQKNFPKIDSNKFLAITDFLGYILRPENDDVLHMYRMKYRRETNALNVLAILNRMSMFSNEEKSISESLRDWLSCKEDHSISTRAHIAAVMELSIEELNAILNLAQ